MVAIRCGKERSYFCAQVFEHQVTDQRRKDRDQKVCRRNNVAQGKHQTFGVFGGGKVSHQEI